MEFSITDVVFVTFFSLLTWAWAKDRPGVMLIPPLMSIAFPLYPLAAAFTSFVTIMLVGTLLSLALRRYK